NAGSSSLKAKLFDANLNTLKSFEINRIGEIGMKTHQKAAQKVLAELKNEDFKVVGHRVVHGGEKYFKLTEITPEVIQDLKNLSILAPQHNPQALEVIKTIKNKKQYALFDTGFFNDLPLEAKIYPLPYKYYKKEGIRRFGFHGISHQYAAEQASNQLGEDILNTNLITIHLGAGCSVAAISQGKPVDISMGFTPLEGLMMMTRAGSIDPGIIFYLMDEKKMAPEKIRRILEFESGILGISGISSDMKDVMFVAGIRIEDEDEKYVPPKSIKCGADGVKRANLAIEVFCRTIRKHVGAYCALLNNKVNALIFTGEIGYNSSLLRIKITKDLRINTLVIKPNEELAIAREINKLLNE
ncbi:acetate/propionate family kinase, partial [Patescibacteria group bacterium]|nr:acetate/propionate family kinase [Patescibacteria group bacterium]